RAASFIVEIRYKRSHFAKLLGFTDQQLSAADKLPELKARGGGPAWYQPRHRSPYRRLLAPHPRREPSRRQLFLTFKGGTGKTSLSVAYAYRLAELGHRVLLIDLDSQGHATQHLGLAAQSLERTVFEILVKGVPIEDVIVPHALAEFDVLPANLRMTTIDISLMPMAGREYKLQRALAGVLDRYEFIVMDAPPSFGLLNLNALMASDDLLRRQRSSPQAADDLPRALRAHGRLRQQEAAGEYRAGCRSSACSSETKPPKPARGTREERSGAGGGGGRVAAGASGDDRSPVRRWSRAAANRCRGARADRGHARPARVRHRGTDPASRGAGGSARRARPGRGRVEEGAPGPGRARGSGRGAAADRRGSGGRGRSARRRARSGARGDCRAARARRPGGAAAGS